MGHGVSDLRVQNKLDLIKTGNGHQGNYSILWIDIPQIDEFWVFEVNFVCQKMSLFSKIFFLKFYVANNFYKINVLLTSNFKVLFLWNYDQFL